MSIPVIDLSRYLHGGTGDRRDIVCERGQLYKIAKDKSSIVTKDRLTKEWTDWVDY